MLIGTTRMLPGCDNLSHFQDSLGWLNCQQLQCAPPLLKAFEFQESFKPASQYPPS